MSISKAQLASFKEIYHKEYGEELNDAEAYEMACNLLGLYEAVYLFSSKINDDDKS